MEFGFGHEGVLYTSFTHHVADAVDDDDAACRDGIRDGMRHANDSAPCGLSSRRRERMSATLCAPTSGCAASSSAHQLPDTTLQV